MIPLAWKFNSKQLLSKTLNSRMTIIETRAVLNPVKEVGKCSPEAKLIRRGFLPKFKNFRIISRPSRLSYSTYFPSFLVIFETALVSIIFILELSVLDKSCLELNFQAIKIICRVPCTAVFLRSRTSGFQYFLISRLILIEIISFLRQIGQNQSINSV